jgi:hypothetical protein
VWIAGWMKHKSPAAPLNPVHAQTSNVGLCAVVLQYLFIPWTFITKCTTKLSEHLKVMSSTDGFALWQKLNQYTSFSIPKKRGQMVLLAEGIVFSFFSLAMLLKSHTH